MKPVLRGSAVAVLHIFDSVPETFHNAWFGVLFGVRRKIVIGHRTVRLNIWLKPEKIRQDPARLMVSGQGLHHWTGRMADSAGRIKYTCMWTMNIIIITIKAESNDWTKNETEREELPHVDTLRIRREQPALALIEYLIWDAAILKTD